MNIVRNTWTSLIFEVGSSQRWEAFGWIELQEGIDTQSILVYTVFLFNNIINDTNKKH